MRARQIDGNERTGEVTLRFRCGPRELRNYDTCHCADWEVQRLLAEDGGNAYTGCDIMTPCFGIPGYWGLDGNVHGRKFVETTQIMRVTNKFPCAYVLK